MSETVKAQTGIKLWFYSYSSFLECEALTGLKADSNFKVNIEMVLAIPVFEFTFISGKLTSIYV
ncbi:MAG: hypothetical protein Q4F84_00555 [Fibrobacter sp.]|nr:hypothetical protein [Fibrobacter sp.]